MHMRILTSYALPMEGECHEVCHDVHGACRRRLDLPGRVWRATPQTANQTAKQAATQAPVSSSLKVSNTQTASQASPGSFGLGQAKF